MIWEEINEWANSLLDGEWRHTEKDTIRSYVPEVAEISEADFDRIIDRMEEIEIEFERDGEA